MAEVVLPVTAGAAIEGRVVDSDGKPVAGVGVIANEVTHGAHTTMQNGRITSGAQARTDAAGGYAIEGLPPGTYEIGALDAGAPMRLRSAPPHLELGSHERKLGVELVVDRPNGTIAGTVTGPDGKPLAEAWVSLQRDVMAMMYESSRRGGGSDTMIVGGGDDSGPETGVPPTLTDAQGHYEVHGLASAIYTVTAEAQRGQLRARADHIRPDAMVDLAVRAVATLSGTVTGPTGPTAVFSVDLANPPVFDRRNFSDGTFSFGRVDPGTYTVTVKAPEGSAEVKVEVQPGTPATVAIALAANATVTGTLVDAAGKPLAGRPVVLSPDHDETQLSIMMEGPPPTSGPDGRFRLEHRAERCGLVVLPVDAMSARPFVKRGLMLEAGKTLELGSVVVTPQDAGPGSGAGSGARKP
jgi:protocatechuate 3,4-dioxygenase beta subunit